MWGDFTEKQSRGWNYWALFLLNSVDIYFLIWREESICETNISILYWVSFLEVWSLGLYLLLLYKRVSCCVFCCIENFGNLIQNDIALYFPFWYCFLVTQKLSMLHWKASLGWWWTDSMSWFLLVTFQKSCTLYT